MLAAARDTLAETSSPKTAAKQRERLIPLIPAPNPGRKILGLKGYERAAPAGHESQLTYGSPAHRSDRSGGETGLALGYRRPP